MDLSLEDFTLDRALLEVRYDFAFPMWDKSGLLGETLRREFGPLSLREASPSKIQAEAGDSLLLTVENEKSAITEHSPRSDLSKFKDKSSLFVSIVEDIFGIKAYLRVGVRLFYLKKYNEKNEAAKDIADSGVIKVPNLEGPNFDVDGPVSEVNYEYRYEGDSKGVSIRMNTISQNLRANTPIQVRQWDNEGDSGINISRKGLQLDMDLYTTAPTPAESFGASEWIDQTLHVMRRDISPYLSS